VGLEPETSGITAHLFGTATNNCLEYLVLDLLTGALLQFCVLHCRQGIIYKKPHANVLSQWHIHLAKKYHRTVYNGNCHVTATTSQLLLLVPVALILCQVLYYCSSQLH